MTDVSKCRMSVGTMLIICGFSYGVCSIYNNFATLYLRQYNTTAQTGVLVALGPLVSLVVPMFWGVCADRARTRKSVMITLLLGSAAGFTLLGFCHTFISIAVSLVLFMIFYSSLTGIMEVMLLEAVHEYKFRYGPVRISGTVVFAFIPLFISPLLSKNINLMFPIYAVMSLIAVVAVILTPNVEKHKPTEQALNHPSDKPSDKTSGGLLYFLRDGRYVLICIILLVYQFAYTCFCNYYPIFVCTERGYSQTIWSLIIFCYTISEIPYLLMLNRITQKFGMEKMLFFGVLINGMKFIVFGFFDNIALVCIVGMLTGYSGVMLTNAGQFYINSSYEYSKRAKAQSFLYAAGIFLPKVFAGFIGGAVVELFGTMNMMLVSGILCASCMLFMPLFLYLGKRAGKKAATLE